MPKEYIQMSLKDVDRLKVLQRVQAKEISQKEGALQIGVQKRQIIRLTQIFKKQGPSCVMSQKRGRLNNSRYSEECRATVTKLIQELYTNFGPTFVSEKLLAVHNIRTGV